MAIVLSRRQNVAVYFVDDVGAVAIYVSSFCDRRCRFFTLQLFSAAEGVLLGPNIEAALGTSPKTAQELFADHKPTIGVRTNAKKGVGRLRFNKYLDVFAIDEIFCNFQFMIGRLAFESKYLRRPCSSVASRREVSELRK